MAAPIPADRLDCEVIVDQRPALPPEYVIDWKRVSSVDEARREHEAFVTRLRKRETPVALYVVELEGQLWACADDDQWIVDFLEKLPKAE